MHAREAVEKLKLRTFVSNKVMKIIVGTKN